MESVAPPDTPRLNVLVTGAAKSGGKTNFAASAPGTVLYNNYDLPNATRLIHRRFGTSPKGKIYEPKLPAYQARQRLLYAHMLEVERVAWNPESYGVQTVVVDPVGELYRRLLEEFSQKAIRPTLPTFGEVSVLVERHCRTLCEAPNVNTVLVCHELLQQNGEEMISIPFTGTKAGSADFGAKLQAMVDIIAYASVMETSDGTETAERWSHAVRPGLNGQPDRVYLSQLIQAKGRNAGDRFNCLGDYRPPDLTEWLQAIAEYESGEEVTPYNIGSANVGTATPTPERADGLTTPPSEPEPEVQMDRAA